MSFALFCTQGMYKAKGSIMSNSITMPIVQETIRPTLFAPPLPNNYVIDNKWFIFFIVLTLTLKTYKGNKNYLSEYFGNLEKNDFTNFYRRFFDYFLVWQGLCKGL